MDGLEERMNLWEVLLSSRRAMRTAQSKAEMVKKDQGSNLRGISKHVPRDLMPDWILRKVREVKIEESKRGLPGSELFPNL